MLCQVLLQQPQQQKQKDRNEMKKKNEKKKWNENGIQTWNTILNYLDYVHMASAMMTILFSHATCYLSRAYHEMDYFVDAFLIDENFFPSHCSRYHSINTNESFVYVYHPPVAQRRKKREKKNEKKRKI